jgi:hypothetical protein
MAYFMANTLDLIVRNLTTTTTDMRGDLLDVTNRNQEAGRSLVTIATRGTVRLPLSVVQDRIPK